jgi:hypothetical protein
VATGPNAQGILDIPEPKPSGSSKVKSYLEAFVSFLDIILEMTSTVYTAIEAICSGLERADERKDKKEDKKVEGTHWKDKLNHAALVVDNTIIEAAVIILTALGGMTASKIELKANGQIVMSADTIQNVYDGEFSQCATPSTAIETASRAPGIVKATSKGIGIAADIANYSVQTHYDLTEKEEEEEL